MRGPYSEYAAPPVYIYPDRPRAGIHFSRVELFQLSVAILALSVALTFLYIRDPLLRGEGTSRAFPPFLAIFFASSLVAVATGVGLHEIAHKAVAQRYGLWAEFRYNPMGLILAFVFAAAIGFLYGAPGATWISGYVTPEKNGRISAAGPGVNVAIGSVFLGIAAVLSPVVQETNLLEAALVFIVQSAAMINFILAGFNMIPVMPLDGAKVWSWNKVVYLGLIGLVVVLFGIGVYAGLFRAVLSF